MDFVYDTAYDDDPTFVTSGNTTNNSSGQRHSSGLGIPSTPQLKLPNFQQLQTNYDITKKFSNLKILQNLTGSASDDPHSTSNQRNSAFSRFGGLNRYVGGSVDQDEEDEGEEKTAAFKYAKNSLDLISYTTSSYTSASASGASVSSSPVLNSAAAVVDILHHPSSSASTSTGGKDVASGNILANRLSRVLNQTNYDSSIKDSLLFLQSKIAESESSADSSNDNGIQDDKNDIQIGGGKNDSGDKVSLGSGVNYKYISSPSILGSIARRNLRGDVETDLLKLHFSSLKQFQMIVSKLKFVKQDLDDLNSCFNEIDSLLTNNISGNSKVEFEINDLIQKRDSLKVKRALLNSFKSNFTLNHYEEHYLVSEKVDDEYFRILDRVNVIYQNCDILLSLNNDKLGIAIMNKMSKLLDVATERISMGLKKQLALIYLQSNFSKDQESINIFQKSLIFVLQKNKDKFDGIVAEIIESRSRIINEDFVNQLNGYTKEATDANAHANSHGRRSTSLFMSQYDSKRFISDLLAYLHNVIVNELELAESLFNFDQGELINKDLSIVIQSVVNKVVGSLSTTIRGSFESILRQETKPAVIVELYQLVELYCMMYGKLISGEQSELLNTLNSLKLEIVEKLFNLVRLKLKELKLEGDAELDDIDEDLLNLPDWIR
ncbi:unnamed protein product [Ambrosiozyma monospora]|uniref:Unnamed protein product n=1 Tax=Ambrosiozyma monospora TaxID=43982 RepID=A0ACB5SVC1_AMBMO|nr:unnamed protein product [Ambrosiozyma monospora]